MASTAASIDVAALSDEVWRLYFDPVVWPSWVDGFGRVLESQRYPDVGGTLRWQSTPAGRGTVTEHVREHEPRSRHRVSFSDAESEGELLTTFEARDAITVVTQTMEYRLRKPGIRGPFVDALFVRPQLRRSLATSLARLRREAEERASAAEAI